MYVCMYVCMYVIDYVFSMPIDCCFYSMQPDIPLLCCPGQNKRKNKMRRFACRLDTETDTDLASCVPAVIYVI